LDFQNPLAEIESSFSSWFERILRLKNELNLPLIIFSIEASREKIDQYAIKRKFNSAIRYFIIEEIEDVFLTNFKFEVTDFVFICASRKRFISYSLTLDMFLPKIERLCEDMDKVLIYPSQETLESGYSNYEDISSNPISKEYETMQKIGKEVGSMFKKK